MRIPLGDQVLVLPDPLPGERQERGVIHVATTQERPVTGTVVAIGPDVRGIAATARVLYRKYGGVEVELPNENEKGDGEDAPATLHLLLAEKEILMRIG